MAYFGKLLTNCFF